MMVDPVLNFLNAVFLILGNLPAPFHALLGVVAVFSVLVIVFKIVRAL